MQKLTELDIKYILPHIRFKLIYSYISPQPGTVLFTGGHIPTAQPLSHHISHHSLPHYRRSAQLCHSPTISHTTTTPTVLNGPHIHFKLFTIVQPQCERSTSLLKVSDLPPASSKFESLQTVLKAAGFLDTSPARYIVVTL